MASSSARNCGFAADAGDQLFWQAGVFYLNEQVDRDEFVDIVCGLVNLRLAYASENEKWELAGWVKNATDEEYMLHNFTMNPGLSQNITPAPPRTYGATLTWNL